MISVPLGTEMFQFPRFPASGLCVHPALLVSPCDGPGGFPIRTSPDITPAHGSPRLFAVFHVLLRRLTPRHPPYALTSFFLRDAERFFFHVTLHCQSQYHGSRHRTHIRQLLLHYSSLCGWKCAG